MNIFCKIFKKILKNIKYIYSKNKEEKHIIFVFKQINYLMMNANKNYFLPKIRKLEELPNPMIRDMLNINNCLKQLINI